MTRFIAELFWLGFAWLEWKQSIPNIPLLLPLVEGASWLVFDARISSATKISVTC